MKLTLKHKGRKIKINAVRVGFLGKFSGLMFKSKHAKNLFFDFDREGKHRIHSFFVFFSFFAVYLDKKNRILEVKRVKPFSPLVSSAKIFSKLIEIPENEENKSLINFLVGKGKGLNI